MIKTKTPWRDFLLPYERTEIDRMSAKVAELKKQAKALRTEILKIRDRGYSRARSGERCLTMKQTRQEERRI